VAKEIPSHVDKLGRALSIDSCVAYPESNYLSIGKVVKMNPKMVKIARLGKGFSSSVNKYPSETVIIDSAALSMYLLKSSK
jgi:hypothetical protein